MHLASVGHSRPVGLTHIRLPKRPRETRRDRLHGTAGEALRAPRFRDTPKTVVEVLLTACSNLLLGTSLAHRHCEDGSRQDAAPTAAEIGDDESLGTDWVPAFAGTTTGSRLSARLSGQ